MDCRPPFDFHIDHGLMLESYRQTALAHCRAAIHQGRRTAVLCLPGNPTGTRNSRALWPGGPIGQIEDDIMPTGGIAVRFDAEEVGAALAAASPETLATLGYGFREGRN